MSLPYPRVGLVIRYAFLWSHEVRAGSTEARKDRPAAIVVATRQEADGEMRIVVAPITHEPPPDDPGASVEIPAAVAKALGLDGERQWLRTDELNRFTWPGFDLRPLPGRPGIYDYGMLPVGLYAELKAGILRRQKALAARVIPRD